MPSLHPLLGIYRDGCVTIFLGFLSDLFRLVRACLFAGSGLWFLCFPPDTTSAAGNYIFVGFASSSWSIIYFPGRDLALLGYTYLWCTAASLSLFGSSSTSYPKIWFTIFCFSNSSREFGSIDYLKGYTLLPMIISEDLISRCSFCDSVIFYWG